MELLEMKGPGRSGGATRADDRSSGEDHTAPVAAVQPQSGVRSQIHRKSEGQVLLRDPRQILDVLADALDTHRLRHVEQYGRWIVVEVERAVQRCWVEARQRSVAPSQEAVAR